MALSSFKRLHYSHYGAVIRDSTHLTKRDGLLPPRTVEQSTVTHLVDPNSKEELLILGTSNLSTKLAHRVKELTEQFKPQSVLVQAGSDFPNHSRGNFGSVEELHKHLETSGYLEKLEEAPQLRWGLRDMIFWYRLNLMRFCIHTVMRTPEEWWRLFTPGLDMKFAVDYAMQNNLELVMAGDDFDEEMYIGLKQEKNFDAIFPLWKYWMTICEAWYLEARDWQKIFRSHSVKSIAETYLDKDQVAWWVRFFEKMLPDQKKIVIDAKDEDMFRTIEQRMTGQRKLAVVNQWHMEGIEKLWRLNHGISIKRPATSGTEDLPLEVIQAYMRGIDKDRARTEEITGDPMGTHGRQIVPYNEENRSHYG